MAATTSHSRSRYCTGSILTVARAAQELSAEGGGTLELTAQDGSFPQDIRRWCQGSGSQLVHLTSESGRFHAKVRVPGRVPSGVHAAVASDSGAPSADRPPCRDTLDDNDGDHDSTVRALLDCRGLRNSAPIHKLAQRVRRLPRGSELDILSDDPNFRSDLRAWCETTGATISSFQSRGNGAVRIRLRLTDAIPRRRRGRSVPHTQAKTDPVPAATPVPRHPKIPLAHAPVSECCIVVSSSGDDALGSALRMAVGATTDGMQTSILFTMDSLEVLTVHRALEHDPSKSWTRRIRNWFTSDTPSDLGPGSRPPVTIAALLSEAQRQGVRLVVCRKSMGLMGITADQLDDRLDLHYDEIATFLQAASQAALSRVF